MSNDPVVPNIDVLNSWKEVAIYLGRGVRTVQRWEMDLGLPVRRPRGKSRSAVIALKPELDQWLTSAPKEVTSKAIDVIKPYKVPLHAHSLHTNTKSVVSKTKQVLEHSLNLCERSKQLCEQMNRALILTARLSASPRKTSPFRALIQPAKQV